MLRVVLAVVLALALVGVAMPVVEDARTDRTSTLAEGELARVAERATGLAATEETGPGGAPRRVLRLSVPDGGLATTPVDYVAIGGVPDCRTARDTTHGDVVAYRVQGGETRVRHLPVDLRVVTDGRVRGDEDPLVLEGDARITLSLVEQERGSTVLVRRDETGARSAASVVGGGRRA